MLLNAYTLFDNKALIYSPPFFVNTDGAAIRMVADICNDLNTQVGRHPGDFSLFQIGTFSDGNGSLEPMTPLRHVIDAVALVTIKQRPFNFDGQPEPTINVPAAK
ncbi:MAG: nonstructural protein [Microvirus sp.]|nr:MAG: nonstructural protein [Microvirus sp.]